MLKWKYGNDMELKYSTRQIFQHKSHKNSLTFISNKTVLYRIRMCERVACNNFAVNVKRLVSPENFVLTSCVPAVTGIQLSNTQCPNLPVVLRLLYGSEVEAVWSDIYSARVIDLTAHTVGTPLAGTAEGGEHDVWGPAQFLSIRYIKPLVLWMLR